MHRDVGARLKVRRWLPPLVWAGVILIVTSLPGPMVPRSLSPYDKAVHFTLYGLFGVLLAREIGLANERWRAAFMALVIAVAFAAADEWHQGFVPGRSRDVADWRADSYGAAAGALLWALSAVFRRNRRTSHTTE